MKEKELSLTDLNLIAKSWFKYLFSKVWVFIAAAIVFGVMGVLYAYFDKPVYSAQITFTSENEGGGNIGAYAGLAAQFGLDLGVGSGSAFEGENLMYLMSSRKMVEKTLLTPVLINGQKILLINYFIKVSDFEKRLKTKLKDSQLIFTAESQTSTRFKDSILKKVCFDINKDLKIEKIDKKSDIISVEYAGYDELFAKIFVEQLVSNVIQYYTDYKVKKTKQNVNILQHQTDSIRSLINGNIVDIAVSSDLNVNPTRQIVRTGIQRKQVDAQVNSALYTELVKNLELSKLSLRKETPLIQIIDTPTLPLEKKKKGRLLTGLIFAFSSCLLLLFYFIIRKIFE